MQSFEITWPDIPYIVPARQELTRRLCSWTIKELGLDKLDGKLELVFVDPTGKGQWGSLMMRTKRAIVSNEDAAAGRWGEDDPTDLVVTISPAAAAPQVNTIIHEFVHAKQRLSGDLKNRREANGDDTCCLWKGTMINGVTPQEHFRKYKALPWEKEAFDQSVPLMRRFLETLSEPEQDLMTGDLLEPFAVDLTPSQIVKVPLYLDNIEYSVDQMAAMLMDTDQSVRDDVGAIFRMLNGWALRKMRKSGDPMAAIKELLEGLTDDGVARVPLTAIRELVEGAKARAS